MNKKSLTEEEVKRLSNSDIDSNISTHEYALYDICETEEQVRTKVSKYKLLLKNFLRGLSDQTNGEYVNFEDSLIFRKSQFIRATITTE